MRLTTIADYVVLPRYQYAPELVNYQEKAPALTMAVPMGEGVMDYRRFLNILNEGFDGWCSYETCSPIRDGGGLPNLRHYAKTYLAYMGVILKQRTLRRLLRKNQRQRHSPLASLD